MSPGHRIRRAREIAAQETGRNPDEAIQARRRTARRSDMGGSERSHYPGGRLSVEHATLINTRCHRYIRRCRLHHAQRQLINIAGPAGT